ncbi:MAG: glycosyl hydrolase [Selenomonas sp.]|nr:glycosyl hydrolase [Selenomonas sp.]
MKADKDGYVPKIATVQPQTKIDLNSLTIPQDVTAADAQATPKTVALLKYLHGIAGSGNILYGHQNDMHRKVGKKLPTDSDTFDLTDDYPAVVGVDGLALTGNELELTPEERASGMTLTKKLAKAAIKADRQGAIVTMSCHMPNFAKVAQREKIDGKYDYRGYSPNVTDGNVVTRILPGGDLNEVFNGYLDLVAEFDGYLQEADVPLLFRPFHENSGSWFWWGSGHCTPQEFRQLFKYTEMYFQSKGLHNMLYVYSPGGGETKSEGDYELTWPGNNYIDIAGLDMYHRDPERGDGWLQDEFEPVMTIVEKFAKSHHKVAAMTETGILCGNSAMSKKGVGYKEWFTDASKIMAKHHMAYFMTWSNFDETNFDQPYMIDENRGHEMINNFIDFYNEPYTVFAKQNADYSTIK